MGYQPDFWQISINNDRQRAVWINQLSGLENRLAATPRGFESLSLRHSPDNRGFLFTSDGNTTLYNLYYESRIFRYAYNDLYFFDKAH